jgi:hypothetical protein
VHLVAAIPTGRTCTVPVTGKYFGDVCVSKCGCRLYPLFCATWKQSCKAISGVTLRWFNEEMEFQRCFDCALLFEDPV